MRPTGHLPRGRPCPSRQRGLSMVELLISLAMGLLIIGAVLFVYFGSKGSYRTERSSSRVQEAGNFGMSAILHDVRQAGFAGCGSRMKLNVWQPQPFTQFATPALPVMAPGQGIYGTTASSWTPPASLNVTPLTTATDVVEVQVATGSALAMVAPPDPSVPAVYLANNCAKIPTDTYLLVSNCTMATIVRVSNTPDTSAASCPANNAAVSGGVQFQYAATDGAGRTVNAFPGGNMALGGANPPTLASYASAQAFDDITYFVAQLSPRRLALFRYSANAGVAEEIMDHIEDLCVMYGVNGSSGLTYVNYAGVAAAGGWANVVSAQISLFVAGDDLGVITNQPALPWCNGATKTPSDGRVYQVFTGTAAFRDLLK